MWDASAQRWCESATERAVLSVQWIVNIWMALLPARRQLPLIIGFLFVFRRSGWFRLPISSAGARSIHRERTNASDNPLIRRWL